MDIQYRGQQRWTGPWDNPNLYGILMGVGAVLAVGLFVQSLKANVSRRIQQKRHLPPTLSPDEAEREGKRPTFNFQLSTCNAAHWLSLTFYFCAAALCGYGLLKSYSRGAWLGTAVGLVFLIWKFFNHETHKTHENQTQQKISTFNFQPSTRRLWLPLSIFLVSLLVISFWQFRHTESPLLRRVFSVGNVNDFSWRNRVMAWQGAGRMMLHKPLAGFGWGKAEEVYSKEYRAARLEESAAIQMNDYLMLGISAGVPALVSLLVYLWLALCRRPSVERREPGELSTFNFQLSTAAKAGAAVLLLGFWFDGGLFKLPTAVVFWVLLELCRRRGDESEGLTTMPAGGESVLASRLVSSLATPSGDTSSGCATFSPSNAEKGIGAHGVTRPALALRWLAGTFAIIALGLTALHLGTPQLAVSERTLSIARKFLVPAGEKNDFEFLAAKPIWSAKRLKTLLQHAHLANYNRSLVNWKLDNQIYREFVLSPEIEPELNGDEPDQIPSPRPSPRLGGEREMASPASTNDPLNPEPSTLNHQPSTNLNWRRPLWEYFYPRIRKESSLEAAAEIVGRHLRERVTVVRSSGGNQAQNEKKLAPPHVVAYSSAAEIWERGDATERGFEVLTVAALRSAGIPARLSVSSGQAEFWNGTEWKFAPKVLPE
jgi:hypothetical protein